MSPLLEPVYTLDELNLPLDLVSLFRTFQRLTDVTKCRILSLIQAYSEDLSLQQVALCPVLLKPDENSAPPNLLVLAGRIKALESLFAPIRLVPSEVLVHIFHLHLKIDHTPALDSSAVHQSPYTLSAVCAFWRETCISNPVLWSQVNISGQGDLISTPDIRPEHAQCVRTSMDRMGSHIPWSLVINLDHPADSLRSHRVPLTNVLIHPATNELHKLHINARAPITGLEGLTLPELESLVVLWWWPSQDHVYPLQSVFPAAPRLTKLVVVNVISLNAFNDKLPWSNLTHLFIEGMSLEKFRALIVHCTKLEESCFSLGDCNHTIQEFMSVPGQSEDLPVTYSNLTKLTLFNWQPIYPHCHNLHFPKIRELNLLYGVSPVIDEWDFSVPRTSSLDCVRRLTISGERYINPSNLQRAIFPIIDAPDNLTHLLLDIDCDYDVLLRHLTHMSHPFHPRLQFLEYLDISIRTCLTCDIIDALQAFILSHSPKNRKHTRNAPTPQCKLITVRVPQSICDASALLAIQSYALDLRYTGKSDKFRLVEEPRPFPLISPPQNATGGYKYWEDGLMDFLNPSEPATSRS